MSDFSNILQDALSLWLDLSEVDPEKKSFVISLGGGMNDLDVVKMHNDIKEALDLDPSNITGYLLLSAAAETYFANRKYTVEELLANSDKVAGFLGKSRELMRLINHEVMTGAANEFTEALRLALIHYGAINEGIERLLGQKHRLSYLRRDALRSVNTLSVDIFSVGKASPDAKPQYAKKVYQFWNVKSMVNTVMRSPDGIALSLIRDPMVTRSFFAFTVKNGENLRVITDRSQDPNPLFKFKTQPDGRMMSDRMDKHYFPYDLLDIQFDESGKHAWHDASKSTDLVPLQQDYDELKPISDLAPGTIIWISMMFDLLADRYWTADDAGNKLSYTGEDIVQEDTRLPVKRDKLALAPLTTEAVLKDDLSDFGAKPGSGRNKWLLDHYGAKVKADVFNIATRPGMIHYLPSVAKNSEDHVNAVTVYNGVVSVSRQEDESLPFWKRGGRYELRQIDLNGFGTPGALDADRRFLARHNLAKAIQREADIEFNAREKEIKTWWERAVKSRKSNIMAIAARKEVWFKMPDRARYPGFEFRGVGGGRHVPDADRRALFLLSKRYDYKERSHRSHGCILPAVVMGDYKPGGDRNECTVTGAMASYTVVVSPKCADDLVKIAGLTSADDLPDVIRNWVDSSRSRGNPKLDLIDPVDTELKDPWTSLNFDVFVHLSKRGLKQIEKQYSGSSSVDLFSFQNEQQGFFGSFSEG